ncbi:MAG: hypothetical protein ACYTEE_11125 [Planctomycetota bacterium]
MKEFKILLLTGLFIMSSFLYGCKVDSSTTTYSMCEEEKEQFAEMVAEKVIELQSQQKTQDLDFEPD